MTLTDDSGSDKNTWHADTMSWDASFGWDGSAITTQIGSLSEAPVFDALMYAYDELQGKQAPRYCRVSWDLTKAAPSDAFQGSAWVSFDLTDLPIQSSDGQCETMASFMGEANASDDLQGFMDQLQWAFGVKSISDVDATALSEWEAWWPDTSESDALGSWQDAQGHFAGGAVFNSWAEGFGNGPLDTHLFLAYALDSKTARLELDKAGEPVHLDLQGEKTMAVGYYVPIGMYAYTNASE